MTGDKTVSICLINWTIKAIKEKKQPNEKSVCCCLCHLERSAVKHSKKPPSRRLWLNPWWLSSQKGPDHRFTTGFCLGKTRQVTLPLLSKSPCWQKESRWSPTCPVCIISHHGTVYSFQNWSQSWLTSCCPRTTPRRKGLGSSTPSPKMSSLLPFGSSTYEHPQQVHVDQRQLPSEKLGNKHLSNSYRCFFLNYLSLILSPLLHEKLKCGV